MLQLTRVHVGGLFGSLDHDIPFSAEGLTFIHGPNGCGKTTVLKLVSGLLDAKFEILREVQFSTLELTFSDSTGIRIERTSSEELPSQQELEVLGMDEDPDENDSVSITVQEIIQGKVLRSQEILLDASDTEDVASAIRKFPNIVTKYVPSLVRVGTRSWRERESRTAMSPAVVARKYGASFPFSFPKWFREKVRGIPRGFIQTQRLFALSHEQSDEFGSPEVTLQQVVELYAEELKKEMAATIERSALSSQVKERSFPHRMLTGAMPSQKEPELRQLYDQLQTRLKDLAEVGLQEATGYIALPTKRFVPTERKVIGLYLSDLNEKLDTFLDLQARINLLKDLYGTKLRRKTFLITRNEGFKINDKSTGQPISPSQLSSGEQHQLVMFYQLVFSGPDRQLFLIDEPEISLHVEWQRTFLSDILRVASLRGHVFLIATHSPQIINERMDLAVPLDGGIQN